MEGSATGHQLDPGAWGGGPHARSVLPAGCDGGVVSGLATDRGEHRRAQLELGVHHLLGRFNSRARLDVESVHRVGSGRMGVELVSSIRSIDLTLKQLIECLLLSLAHDHGQILNCHSTSGVILYGELGSRDADVFRWDEEINHLLD